MFRWYRELRNSKLKCERKGHDWIERVRRGYEMPSQGKKIMGGYVADRIKQIRTECQRCKTSHPEKGTWETVHRSGLDGLSLPTSKHITLEETGFVFLD